LRQLLQRLELPVHQTRDCPLWLKTLHRFQGGRLFLSAFATVFLGLCLFILLFLTKQPLYPDQPASEFALPPFGSLVESPIPAL